MDPWTNATKMMMPDLDRECLIDLICLGYAKEENEPEEEKNMNTLEALAHVATDFVRSSATIIAASVIIHYNGGDNSMVADGIAGMAASVTIVLGSLLGFYEWAQDFRQGQKLASGSGNDSSRADTEDDDDNESSLETV